MNSIKKGKRTEHKLLEILNKIVPNTFFRTLSSGAFPKIRENYEPLKDQYGDIYSPKIQNLLIEVKSRGELDLYNFLLFKKNSEIFKFIEQAKKDSQTKKESLNLKDDVYFLLAIKEDHKDFIYITNYIGCKIDNSFEFNYNGDEYILFSGLEDLTVFVNRFLNI